LMHAKGPKCVLEPDFAEREQLVGSTAAQIVHVYLGPCRSHVHCQMRSMARQ
jgi:hypothetical protein